MQPESAIDSLPEPWLKLPARSGKGGATEGPKPHAALEKYYQASANQRSLRQAGADVKRRETLMERYSSQFFRVVRAAAWDRHEAQIAAAECEQRLREDRELMGAPPARSAEGRLCGEPTDGCPGGTADEAPAGRQDTPKKRDASDHPATILKPHRSHAAALALLEGGHELGLDCIRRARPASAEGATADEPAFVLLPAPTKQGGAE
jgi:hypothetical protein